MENGDSRAHSLCEDGSERALSSGSNKGSYTGAKAVARVSYLFLMLRNWVSHRINPVESNNSFLERIRGPTLKDATSIENDTQCVGHNNTQRKKK
ncbi:hypothetical protein CHARACLAT_017821 [Characodon lateralis]|uniref:Uncharacterized protein n=1 Tax=Characodon lateralis TaxID=208331 RepID=A0ABU7CSK7_9TELE|nr:hypothetical protein [Characodon lateralis]